MAAGTQLTVLGGLTPAGTSLAQVSTVDPRTGGVTSAGSLATAVHDAAAATIGRTTFVLGGGSPDTVPTVQSFPAGRTARPGSGDRVGGRPAPSAPFGPGHRHASRPDRWPRAPPPMWSAATTGPTTCPSVLATTDGTHFTTVARLPVPVRYPAVVADAGRIYAFGGQVPSPGGAAAATDDIQMIDPASHRVVVVGHLPQPLYGASAFLIGGTIYVAGGQVPGERPSPRSTPSCPPPGRCSMPAFSPRPTPSPDTPRSAPGVPPSATWSEGRWPPSPATTRPVWRPARLLR